MMSPPRPEGISISAIELREIRHLDVLWASGLGLGFLRPGPGTWGSLGAAAVWWLWLGGLPMWVQLGIAGAYFLTGWWCSERIGNRLGIKDASQIVADEVAGMWLALSILPQVWWLVLAALALFRLLDIFKPGPIGWLDRELQGGLGVMADDLLAGAITGGLLWLVVWQFGTGLS